MKDKNSKPFATTADAGGNTESEEFIDLNIPEPPFLKFLMGEKAKSANERFCIAEDPPIAIVGVGKFGCAMLECAGLTLRRPYITIALDVDRKGLTNNTYATRKLLVPCEAGEAKTEPDAGRITICQEEEIGRLLTGLSVVILLTGLGDSTETELSIIVADILAKRNNPTFAFAVTAPESEGEIRHKCGVAGLQALRERVTAVLDVPYDPLDEGGVISTRNSSFERMEPLIEQFTRVIASPSPTSGLSGVDIAEVISVLHGGRTLVMGCGAGSGEDGGIVALEAALSEITLKGNDSCLADGVMMLFEVGLGFGIEQFARIGDLSEKFPSYDAEIKMSCIPIKELDADIRVTVLARLLPDSQD